MNADIRGFLDSATNTISYVLADPAAGRCAIIDPVWDFDPKSGRTSTESVERMERFVAEHGYQVELILETHAHADHLSASQHLKRTTGAPVAIGARIVEVQAIFKEVFNLGDEFTADGRQPARARRA